MKDEDFKQWLGREQSLTESLTTAPMEGLAATLDRDSVSFDSGDALPELWHWLYFLSPARHSSLADDGHPTRGDFLPPIPLPRRMWAGSRLHFHRPLRAGETLTRRSLIKSIKLKQGKSGKLGFVCVEHEISDSSGIALTEEHDIVYREMPTEGGNLAAANEVDSPFDFARTISPNPAMLFRYSALTFNAHRIHYDRSYAMNIEHYPGLVVHGPLLATLLLELFHDNYPEHSLASFEFKALRPVFDMHNFQCCGSKLDTNGQSKLWVVDHENKLCLEAVVTAMSKA